jgi:hypothetical protein
MSRISLHEIAHARAGDKGNRLNVSVIAYHPNLWPILLEQVTEARVHDLFRHRGAAGVVRYVLPNLHALNFVIDEVLEGGVNASLNLDIHGKTNSFRVLSLEVEVPDAVLARLAEYRRDE